MASKKLQYSDIADPGLLDPLIKEIKEVDVLLGKMAQGFRDVAKAEAEVAKNTKPDTYENIEKKTKAIDETIKSTKELDKVEKERLRLQEKLASLEAKRIADSEKMKARIDKLAEALKNETKLRKDAEKNRKKEDENKKKYNKTEKETIRLKERLAELGKDDAIQNQRLKVEIAERTRLLKEEAKLNSESTTQYQKLSIKLGQLRKEYKDTALQYGRNSKAAKELRGEIGELSDTLEELDRDVKQQFREIGRYEKALKGLNNTAAKLGALGLLIKGFEALSNAFSANQAGADAIAKAIGRVTITLRVFIQRLIGAGGALKAIFQGITLGFKEFGINAQLVLAELPQLLGGSATKAADLRKEIAALNAQQAQLATQGLPQLQAAFKGIGKEIADTIALNDKLIDRTTQYRKVAIGLKVELGELTRAQSLLQQESDDNTLSLEKQTEAAEKLLLINEQIAEKNIQLAQNEVALAKLRVQTDKGSLDAREALAEAVVALAEAETEAEVARAETQTRLREINRDNIELDLDQLIDLADRRKTINETIAADERLSLETRTAAAQKALVDIEKSFRAQAEKIQEGTGIAFNIDDLIDEEDTVKLNERIKALGFDEIRQNRLREILQERIQATEDLRGVQGDLNEAEAETRDIESDILAQSEALLAIQRGEIDAKTVLAKLEERRNELAKENLRTRIDELEVGSLARLELEQELNDLLLEEAQEKADKETEIEAKKYEKIGELAQQGFQVLSDASDKYFEKRIENIDKELEAANEREETLRELAAAGNQTAQESLVAEQQRQAQLELQRAEQIKRQKLAELALSAIEVYGAKVAAGDKNPLASTIADVSVLRAFIESLPGFYEGSEMVGDDLAATISGRDGHVIRVDGAERILSPEQNAIIPRSMSNYDLATMAAGSGASVQVDFSRIEKQLQEVKGAIEKQEVYKGMDFNAQKEAITFHVEKKGKLTRKHKSIKSVWG